MGDYRGEYTAVAGEARVDKDGRIAVTYHMPVENGRVVLRISYPPGTVVRIGEKIQVELFGVEPSQT
jgi:hypothetical protein